MIGDSQRDRRVTPLILAVALSATSGKMEHYQNMDDRASGSGITFCGPFQNGDSVTPYQGKVQPIYNASDHISFLCEIQILMIYYSWRSILSHSMDLLNYVEQIESVELKPHNSKLNLKWCEFLLNVVE